MEQFNQTELKMLITILDEVKEQQSNAGCNDLFLPKTEENIEFMHFFNEQAEDHERLRLGKTYITGFDTDLTDYFINKLKKMTC